MTTKLSAAVLALAGFTATEPLTLTAQSSVWKLSRDGGTAYLGAKCHFLRAADAPWPQEFEAAYAAAEALVLETDPARLQSPEAQHEIVALGQYDAGASLQHELAPATWKAIEEYSLRTSVPLKTIDRLRPWFLSFMVTELELQKLGVTGTAGLEHALHRRALADHKTIVALESYEQQLQFMTQLGAGQEDAIVLHSIREAARLREMITPVVAAWRTGDLAALDRWLNERLRRDLPDVFATLVVQRSRAWLPRIAALVSSDRIELILVDAAHLPGPDGLIAGLQADGCTVEQLRAEPPATP